MTASEEKQYAIPEAMERLSLSRAEIYRRVKDKALKADKVDRQLRFGEAELGRYAQVLIDERQVQQQALSDWLTFFAERLPPPERDTLPQIADLPVAEQVAELGRRILLVALATGATDLYLDPLHAGDRLLLGTEGNRRETARFPAPLASPLKAWFRALAPLGDISTGAIGVGLGKREIGEQSCQFRLAAIPTLLGEHLHLRFFPEDEPQSAVELGYTSEQANALAQLLAGQPGLLLLVSPGDGASDHHRLNLARQLSAAGRLVVSLEHRIQHRADELVQLDLATTPDFARLWQTALGMGPDILLFDAIDSLEEARAALEGVGSGAVVVAQVRSTTALDGIDRLLRFELERHSLARYLRGTIERISLRCLCPDCRSRRPLEAEEAALLGADSVATVGVPSSCDRCGDGFVGRLQLYGLWPADAPLLAWIRDPVEDAPPPTPPAELALASAVRQAVLDGKLLLEEALPFIGERPPHP